MAWPSRLLRLKGGGSGAIPEPHEVLILFSELAIAVAGFTGLFALLRQKPRQSTRSVERVRALASVPITLLFAAAIPLVLLRFRVMSSGGWRACSAILAIMSVSDLATTGSRMRREQSPSPLGGHPHRRLTGRRRCWALAGASSGPAADRWLRSPGGSGCPPVGPGAMTSGPPALFNQEARRADGDGLCEGSRWVPGSF